MRFQDVHDVMASTPGSFEGETIAADNDLFELKEEIGRGGMGVIFHAHQRILDRDVAVKMLKGDDFDNATVQRLIREAHIVSNLRHHNIVQFFTVAMSVQGEPFIVMELLEGTTLSDILQETPRLEKAKLFDIFDQTLSGLEAAHEAGVVHRDLKPSNIFVTTSGTVKILDFGIAKQVNAGPDGQSLTQTGMLLGSPAFMSPEQLSNAKEIDARSDLYSIGCVLFNCVAGHPPFSADNPLEMAYKQINERSPTIGCDPSLEAVIAKALAKDPAERIQTAGEFRTLMDEVKRGQSPVVSRHSKKLGAKARKFTPQIALLSLVLAGVFLLMEITREAPDDRILDAHLRFPKLIAIANKKKNEVVQRRLWTPSADTTTLLQESDENFKTGIKYAIQAKSCDVPAHYRDYASLYNEIDPPKMLQLLQQGEALIGESIKPDAERAHQIHEYGRAYGEMGSYEDAERCFKAASKLNAENSESANKEFEALVHQSRARTHLRRGSLAKAEQEFRQATAIWNHIGTPASAPKFIAFNKDFAQFLIQEDQLLEAQRVIETAREGIEISIIEDTPRHADWGVSDTYVIAARAWLPTNPDKAKKYFAKAEELIRSHIQTDRPEVMKKLRDFYQVQSLAHFQQRHYERGVYFATKGMETVETAHLNGSAMAKADQATFTQYVPFLQDKSISNELRIKFLTLLKKLSVPI